MKAQCDLHGCSELLCGCPVENLEDNSYFSEQIKAKDEWINNLLKEIEVLKGDRK